MATVLETEEAVYGALCNRYKAPEWAIFAKVANGTGARASRWADALAMSLWPSRGLEVMGFEIKVSRGDLLRELKNPAKAEAVAKYCDRWWIAAGSKSVAKPEELPRTWGLLVPHGQTMKIVKDAEPLQPEEISREFLAAILRRAHEGVDRMRTQVRREIYQELRTEIQKQFEGRIKALEEVATAQTKLRTDLQEQLRCATGSGFHPETIGKAIDLLQRLGRWNGALTSMTNVEHSMRRDADRLVEVAETLKLAQNLCAPLHPERAAAGTSTKDPS